MNVCDGVMLDVKAFDCDAHKKLTGMSNEQVLKNAVYLAEHGKLEEIRTVIVPDQLPNEDTVFQITKIAEAVFRIKNKIRYKNNRLSSSLEFVLHMIRFSGLHHPMKMMKIQKESRRINGFENIILI